MKLLIGICGRARHGKDSTALAIKQRLEARGVSVFYSSISTMIFEAAQKLGRIPGNITREQCTTQDLAELVVLGYEYRMKYGENVWIGDLSERAISSKADVVIVTGIRFGNEVDWVEGNEGILLRVTRYNSDGSMFISPDRDANNIMETCLNRVNPDFEISVKTGQEPWLHWQGVSFANFVLETYLKEVACVPSIAHGTTDDAGIAWG